MSDERPDTGETRAVVTARRVVVPRWVQLVGLPLLVLAIYVVARAAGPVLLIFTIAAVIALILNPLVAFVQRGRLPRGVAIFVVYAGFFAVLALAGFLLANPISEQVSAFRKDVPSIVDSANERLADLQRTFDDRGIDIQLQDQGRTALETLQDRVAEGTGEIISFGTALLETLVTASFGLILVFVLSIYMLLYGQRIGNVVRAVMPPGDGTQADDYPARVVRAVAGYVRGQLLFSLAMGTGAGVGLYLYGVAGDLPRGQDVRPGLRDLLRPDGADPLRRAVPRRGPADARRLLRRSAHRALGRAAVRGPAADRGARRRARRSSGTRCASTRCS